MITILSFLFSFLLCFHTAPYETDGTVKLSAGQHVFPFQFQLPVQLPGSFEGRSRCYVRYWLKGTIDKPWKFDPEVKYTFTVGSMLDLNLQPNATVSFFPVFHSYYA